MLLAVIHQRAAAAKRAYNDLIGSDGVSSDGWLACARELHAAANDLEDAGQSASLVNTCRDRAVDAGHNAITAARMVEMAAAKFGRFTAIGAVQS